MTSKATKTTSTNPRSIIASDGTRFFRSRNDDSHGQIAYRATSGTIAFMTTGQWRELRDQHGKLRASFTANHDTRTVDASYVPTPYDLLDPDCDGYDGYNVIDPTPPTYYFA